MVRGAHGGETTGVMRRSHCPRGRSQEVGRNINYDIQGKGGFHDQAEQSNPHVTSRGVDAGGVVGSWAGSPSQAHHAVQIRIGEAGARNACRGSRNFELVEDCVGCRHRLLPGRQLQLQLHMRSNTKTTTVINGNALRQPASLPVYQSLPLHDGYSNQFVMNEREDLFQSCFWHLAGVTWGPPTVHPVGPAVHLGPPLPGLQGCQGCHDTPLPC